MDERGSRKSVFHKGIKRLGKSASILNFDKTLGEGTTEHFAAIGYDSAKTSAKPLPIHRISDEEYRSLESPTYPRQGPYRASLGSASSGSLMTRRPTQGSMGSTDPYQPSSELTDQDNFGSSADLAEKGLHLAGYGLDPPPEPVLRHSSTTSASSLGSRQTQATSMSMPDSEIVDQMFERLLVVRVFSDKAMRTLRDQGTRRKWDMLVRESQTNPSFDLAHLRRSIAPTERRIPAEDKRKLQKQPSGYNLLSRITKKQALSKEEAAEKRKIREGTPEWFVAKIMSDKLTPKEFKKLEKKLVENSYSTKYHQSWVQGFTEAQGESALSVVLSRINKKSIKSNDELEMEFIIVKCLKHIINAERLEIQELGDESLTLGISNNKPHVIKSMIFSLTSPRISTRKLVTEVMIFLSYYKDHEYLPHILGAMHALQDLKGDLVRFQPWLGSLSNSLEQHFRSGDRFHQDLVFKDYALTSLLLINSIVEGTISIRHRVSLRREFNDSQIIVVFEKLKQLGDERILEEVDKYEVFAEEDYNEFTSGGISVSHSTSAQASAISSSVPDSLVPQSESTSSLHFYSNPTSAPSVPSLVPEQMGLDPLLQDTLKTYYHGLKSGAPDVSEQFMRAIFAQIGTLKQQGLYSEEDLGRQLRVLDHVVLQVTDHDPKIAKVYQRMAENDAEIERRVSVSTSAHDGSSVGDSSFAVSADFINELERMFSARSAKNGRQTSKVVPDTTIREASVASGATSMSEMSDAGSFTPSEEARRLARRRRWHENTKPLPAPPAPPVPGFLYDDWAETQRAQNSVESDILLPSSPEENAVPAFEDFEVSFVDVDDSGGIWVDPESPVDVVEEPVQHSVLESLDEAKSSHSRKGHFERSSFMEVESKAEKSPIFAPLDTLESPRLPSRSDRRKPQLDRLSVDEVEASNSSSAFIIDPDVQRKIQERLSMSKIKVFQKSGVSSTSAPISLSANTSFAGVNSSFSSSTPTSEITPQPGKRSQRRETAFDRMRREREQRLAAEDAARSSGQSGSSASPSAKNSPRLASPVQLRDPPSRTAARLAAQQSTSPELPPWSGERYSGLYEKFDSPDDISFANQQVPEAIEDDTAPVDTSSPQEPQSGLNEPIVFYEVSDEDETVDHSAPHRLPSTETSKRLSLMLGRERSKHRSSVLGAGQQRLDLVREDTTNQLGTSPDEPIVVSSSGTASDHDDSFLFGEEPKRTPSLRKKPSKSIAIGTSPLKDQSRGIAVGTSPIKESIAVGTSPVRSTYMGSIKSPLKERLPEPVKMEIGLSPIRTRETSPKVDKISKPESTTGMSSNPASQPPPPLPSFLTEAASKAPAPPPAPPVPSFLSGTSGAASGPVPSPPPPPPPPVPGFLGNPSDSSSSTTPSGIPPPPPPPPTNIFDISSDIPKAPAAATATLNEDDPLQSLAIRPKQKLKQMHWDKIDDIEKTFWTDIEHGKLSGRLLEKGILTEVEQVFVAKSSVVKRKKEMVASKVGAKAQKVSFLQRDLAQSFGINMHMFSSIEPMTLVLKVLHCDKDVLENISVLEFFNQESLTDFSDQLRRQLMPYSTDYSGGKPKIPKQDPDELERADRLFLELCFNLSHYWKSRSRALLLTQTYSRDYSDLCNKLDLIDKATTQLKSSQSLKNVLGIIRSVGNFMNDTSKQAMGFKLDTLQRLKFMKDDKNSSNFLHYIERIIRNEFPEYGSFVDDLAMLQHVHNVSIEQMDQDCKDFERIINNVSMSITKGNLSDPSRFHPEDRILKAVVGPMEKARLKNSILQTRWESVLSEFKGVMELFGENANEANSRNSFLSKFVVFINDFKKAHVENIQREEEQRVYEARKRMIEESKLKKRKAEESVADDDDKQPSTQTETKDSKEEEEDGDDSEGANTSRMSTNSDVIDTLLERLKSSNPRGSSAAKDRRSRNRRSKAMSFYGLPASTEEDTEQKASNKEYDSVNALKRRMTTRKRDTNKDDGDGNADSIYLRTQAMLNQLRT